MERPMLRDGQNESSSSRFSTLTATRTRWVSKPQCRITTLQGGPRRSRCQIWIRGNSRRHPRAACRCRPTPCERSRRSHLFASNRTTRGVRHGRIQSPWGHPAQTWVYGEHSTRCAASDRKRLHRPAHPRNHNSPAARVRSLRSLALAAAIQFLENRMLAPYVTE